MRKFNAFLVLSCLSPMIMPFALKPCCNNLFHGIAETEIMKSGDNKDLSEFGHSYMVNYFKNLTNIGYNEKECSCGYVATAMLLNYYDNVINDNIVPECFEVNTRYNTPQLDYDNVESPGTRRELDSGVSDFDTRGYISYLKTFYQDTSLHTRLVLIGTNSLKETSRTLSSNFQTVFGTTTPIIIDTINKYFEYINAGIKYSISSIEKYKNEEYQECFDFIDEKLYEGKPVIACFGGHARIIYGHSPTKYLMHEGMIDQTDKTINYGDFGTKIRMDKFAVISLDIEGKGPKAYHYHSNYYNDDNAYDKSFINHNNHLYTHHYDYSDINNFKHKAYCKCGLSKLESHCYISNFKYDEPFKEVEVALTEFCKRDETDTEQYPECQQLAFP